MMKLSLSFLSLALVAGTLSFRRTPPAHTAIRQTYQEQQGIYHDGWIDFNKNGKKDIYEDPAQPAAKRADDLLRQMNTAEKLCQLATLYGYGAVLKDRLPQPGWKDSVWKDG